MEHDFFGTRLLLKVCCGIGGRKKKQKPKDMIRERLRLVREKGGEWN